MTAPYTIVLWCADTSPLASFAAAHLLQTGLDTANRGRLGDEIPVAVGVAVPRRLPIISREVSARGMLRSRQPRVKISRRFDYLLTFASGDQVAVRGSLQNVLDAPVIFAPELVEALEALSLNAMAQDEIVSLFNSVAQTPTITRASDRFDPNLRALADTCQQLVAALSR